MKVKVKMTPTQAQLLIVYKIGLATPTSYMNIDGFGGGVGILVSIASYLHRVFLVLHNFMWCMPSNSMLIGIYYLGAALYSKLFFDDLNMLLTCFCWLF